MLRRSGSQHETFAMSQRVSLLITMVAACDALSTATTTGWNQRGPTASNIPGGHPRMHESLRDRNVIMRAHCQGRAWFCA